LQITNTHMCTQNVLSIRDNGTHVLTHKHTYAFTHILTCTHAHTHARTHTHAQLGHRASECTSGTVNWRQIYGDNAFILRPPVYWSEELAAKKAKQPDAGLLERQAKEYSKVEICMPMFMRACLSPFSMNGLNYPNDAVQDRGIACILC